MNLKVFIGHDSREDFACRVAASSLLRRSSIATSVEFLRLQSLYNQKLYTRETIAKPDGTLFDPVSQAPMSTEHAIARFFIPFICKDYQYALFVDGDVLFRSDIAEIMRLADPHFAIQCVKHDHAGEEGTKKGGLPQSSYARKNWSSVMLFNLWHPGNKRLTLEALNEAPGRDLHGFCWLKDQEIGELPASWNHLAGVLSPPADPDLVHFTLGLPYVDGYSGVEFADEWREEAELIGVQKHANV